MAVRSSRPSKQVARRQPRAPALLARIRAGRYADLLHAVHAAAQRSQTRAPERGARVALLLRNSPQYVALYYGALAAGCVVVPLNAQERASVLAQTDRTLWRLARDRRPCTPGMVGALRDAVDAVRDMAIAVELTMAPLRYALRRARWRRRLRSALPRGVSGRRSPPSFIPPARPAAPRA